jgi:hypothetical protein
MRYFILFPLFIFLVTMPLFQVTTFRVIYPNGGETLYAGTQIKIQWTPPGENDGVIIVLYKKGIKFITVARGVKNSGEYIWKIPADIPPAEDYRIRIRLVKDLSVNDFSDRDFGILQKNNA